MKLFHVIILSHALKIRAKDWHRALLAGMLRLRQQTRKLEAYHALFRPNADGCAYWTVTRADRTSGLVQGNFYNLKRWLDARNFDSLDRRHARIMRRELADFVDSDLRCVGDESGPDFVGWSDECAYCRCNGTPACPPDGC